MILLIDNFDSFTYNLVDYFNQLGIKIHIVRNNESLEKIKQYDYAGVVLSPGPERPEKSGNLLNVIEYFHNKTPLLGICLGHQAIGCFYGATLEKANVPMHGKVSEIRIVADPLFENIPLRINVVRYHSLILSNLPSQLKPIALSANEEIMGIRHKSRKIWGLQFHPEAYLSDYGLKMLENWVRVIN